MYSGQKKKLMAWEGQIILPYNNETILFAKYNGVKKSPPSSGKKYFDHSGLLTFFF